MKKLSTFALCFSFCSMLFILGSWQEAFAHERKLNIQDEQLAQAAPHSLEGKINLYGFEQARELLLSLPANFPVPTENSQPDHGWGDFIAIELNIRQLTAHYLARSRHIYCSLSIRDLIFPFDYFW